MQTAKSSQHFLFSLLREKKLINKMLSFPIVSFLGVSGKNIILLVEDL